MDTFYESLKEIVKSKLTDKVSLLQYFITCYKTEGGSILLINTMSRLVLRVQQPDYEHGYHFPLV